MGDLIFWAFIIGWPVGAIYGYRKTVANGYSEAMAGIVCLLLGPFAPLLAFVKPARPLPPPR